MSSATDWSAVRYSRSLIIPALNELDIADTCAGARVRRPRDGRTPNGMSGRTALDALGAAAGNPRRYSPPVGRRHASGNNLKTLTLTLTFFRSFMNYSDTDRDAIKPSALVAIFATRELAHHAIESLHGEGFHRTWLGVTQSMTSDTGYGSPADTETRVESDNALARFFGAGDQTLHEALLKHGVSADVAARLDGTLPGNSAIVTVDGANHPELAAQIVAECDGEIVSSLGAKSLYDAYATESATPGLSKDRLADLGEYSKGEKLDEARRLQLREERLTVDKVRESAGEAIVSKKVVTQQAEMDVPVMREELYIERRPASETYGEAGVIGSGETIRVPLERERVVVDKRTVATEEVVVGQRQVEGTEHISETLRKEELDVDSNVASTESGREATSRQPLQS